VHMGDRNHTTNINFYDVEHDLKVQSIRFSNSLKFPEMHERENHITARYSETFEWIFDAKSDKPWDSFPEWLRSGNGVFWISGKAGAGKSTLMKFLCNDVLESSVERGIRERLACVGNACYSSLLQEGRCNRKAI